MIVDLSDGIGVPFHGPRAGARPEFGDLFKEVVVDVEKERQLRGKDCLRASPAFTAAST